MSQPVRIMTRVLAFLLLPALAAPAFAQTADEIIEKHLAAMGGRDALGKLTSRKATGTVTVSTPAGNLSGPVESYAKAPNKSRAYMKLDLTALGAGEMVIDQRFDGTVGIAMNSLQGDSDITGAQLENMRNGVFPSALLTYKQTGTRIDVLPRETVAGKSAIVLLVTPKVGPATRLFLDADTYLGLRTVTRILSPQTGTEVDQMVEPSDYRTVDGVKVAFRVVNSNPTQTVTITLTKVEHNVALDDAMFVKK